MRNGWGPLLVMGVFLIGAVRGRAEEPVALRITSMPVVPSHMPGIKVWVKNQGDDVYRGSIRLELPEGWQPSPESREVHLEAGATTSVSFTIHDGKTREENRYPIVAVAEGAGREVRRSQEIVCASAPYFKPEIDGNIDDWKDAIPVTFVTGNKRTEIRTFWNRRQFSMLVAVEEDELTPMAPGRPCDAVQIAIAPADATTSSNPAGEAARYEFLLASTGPGQGGRCFLLAEPGTKLADTQTDRELAQLEIEDPKLVIARKGNTTCYEWGVSFRSLAGIRPSEGREFCLSVLVHDPGGTGLRDWGEAAGLWPSQRNRLAWSRWPGADWPEHPPMDSKLEWGMCSSKY